jgi:hypothetical protein
MALRVLFMQLLQQEIIDETDRYMDNEQLQQVDPNQVSRLLPDNLKQVGVTAPPTGMLGLQAGHTANPGQHAPDMQDSMSHSWQHNMSSFGVEAAPDKPE